MAQICKESLGVSHSPPEINDFSIFEAVDPDHMAEFMQLAYTDVRARRAIGAMVGMAVADSVGAVLEFLPVGQPGSYFCPKTLQVFGELNKFELKPGQWTDDTSMGLCLADSLMVCNGYDGADIRIRFWNWWNRGYNNTFRYDTTRSDSIGLGGNTSLSLLLVSHKGHATPRFEGLGEDAGNGSVMRLAPVPIYFHAADEDLIMRVSAESSFTTHPGASAADACAYLGFVLARAINRPTTKSMTAAQFLDSCAEAYLARPEVEAQLKIKKLLLSQEPEGSSERCWNWRDPQGPFLLETIAARGKSYNGYPVAADYFGSYSMDGLAMALHSVYHTKSYMAAVARCVNFLGDADSTGAICGQIAGAFYGIGAIDDRLQEQLNQWDDGEIALRGALLYTLGMNITLEAQEATGQKSAMALAFDRNKAAEKAYEQAQELLRNMPKPPPLPSDRGAAKQPPKSVAPALLQATASMQAAIAAASKQAQDKRIDSGRQTKKLPKESDGMLACTLAADSHGRANQRTRKQPAAK